MSPTVAQRYTTHELRELADIGAQQYADADAADILRWADETFGENALLSQSMANTALAHLVAEVAPRIPIVFLDTGYHFPETLETARQLVERTGIRLITLEAVMTKEEQEAQFGPDLFARDHDRCCRLRKVRPMEELLDNYDAWISGMRLAAAPHRAERKVIEYDSRRHVVKINPLLYWSDQQLLEYTIANDVVVNPLMYQGYPSIGCAPCTRKVEAADDPRSGRWAGSGKLECGLHI